MKYLVVILAFLFLGHAFADDTPVSPVNDSPVGAINDSPVGKWKTFSDETGKAESIVEITQGADGKLSGKILTVFPKPDKPAHPKCDKCEGERKDQPVEGMVFLWDMEKRSRDWGRGEILDPNNGKIYDAKMKVIEDGKKLQVRGFIGISLLGRTQYWERQ